MEKHITDERTGLCIKCYEDHVSGKRSDEMFMRFSGKYETERLELKEKISAYRKAYRWWMKGSLEKKIHCRRSEIYANG